MVDGFEHVKTWLANTFNIKVSDEWLVACLEWIHQENQGSRLRPEQLQSLVFDQWLVSDLSEIGQPCLPEEVSTEPKVELVSNYPLQVNSCVDAGFPLYGQMQKLQGNDNPNEQVNGDRPYQPAWEPKPSSLHVLDLTDGHRPVRACEVEKCRGLQALLTPGTKILVSGPLVCRSGMIMLLSGHVQVLGGEVDTLAEAHGPLATLANHMDRNRQAADGSTLRKEFSGEFITRGAKKKIEQDQKWEKRGGSSFASTSQAHNNRGGLSSCSKTESKNNWSNQMPSSSIKPYGINTQSKKPKVDEWEDDLDYAELFHDEMEAMNDIQNIQPTTVSNYAKKNPSRTLNKNSGISGTFSNTQSHKFNVDRKEEDMFDDDMDLLEAELSVTESCDQSPSGLDKASHLPWLNPSKRLKLEKPKTTKEFVPPKNKPCVEYTSALKSKKVSSPNSFSSNIQIETSVPSDSKGEENSSSSCSPVIPIMSNSINKPNLSKISNLAKSQKQTKLSDLFSANSVPKHKDDFDSEIKVEIKEEIKEEIKTEIKEEIKQETAPSDSSIQSVMPTLIKQEHGLMSPITAYSSSGSSPLTPAPAFLQASTSAIVQPFHNAQISESDTGFQDLPFTYLSRIPFHPAGSLVVVKAFISTLTTKLTACNGERWALACRINDGTASLDVDLHNNVLTELIGFTAADSLIMKQRIRTEPEVKELLQEGLTGCQNRLANTSCLMQLQKRGNEEYEQDGGEDGGRCTLVKFISVTAEHVMQLRGRQR